MLSYSSATVLSSMPWLDLYSKVYIAEETGRPFTAVAKNEI